MQIRRLHYRWQCSNPPSPTPLGGGGVWCGRPGECLRLLGSKSRRIQRAMASRTKDQHLDGAKVRDFFMFCARGRGTWPVLPITAGKVYRWFYSIMRRKKLKSSWKSVLPYKKALMRWATQYKNTGVGVDVGGSIGCGGVFVDGDSDSDSGSVQQSNRDGDTDSRTGIL